MKDIFNEKKIQPFNHFFLLRHKSEMGASDEIEQERLGGQPTIERENAEWETGRITHLGSGQCW